jgi:hypothetical protein
VAASALALGPQAPFTPPAATAASAATATPADRAAGPAADAAGLTGVRLGPGLAEALIDGRWWAKGSSPRGARLLLVRHDSVRLRHADGRLEELFLHPHATALAQPAPRGIGAKEGIAK